MIKQPSTLAEIVKQRHGEHITHDYSICYKNVHHFTWESVLLIIKELHNIYPGDTVLIPDYPEYPDGLIRRIVGPDIKLETRHIELATWPNLKVNTMLYQTMSGIQLAPSLCAKLMTYIKPKDVPQPSVFLKVRLHNRRWMPASNVQKLIDYLKPNYNVIVGLHPTIEQISRTVHLEGENQILDPLNGRILEIPSYKDCTVVIDSTYEEQLECAKACYAWFGLASGAGSVYGAIANIKQVAIMPIKNCENDSAMGPKDDSKSIVLTDGKETCDIYGRYQHYDDVFVPVERVIETFNKLRKCR